MTRRAALQQSLEAVVTIQGSKCIASWASVIKIVCIGSQVAGDAIVANQEAQPAEDTSDDSPSVSG